MEACRFGTDRRAAALRSLSQDEQATGTACPPDLTHPFAVIDGMTSRQAERNSGVLGYVHLARNDGDSDNARLLSQRDAIEGECARRGLELVAIAEDIGSSLAALERPALNDAMNALDAGSASFLMVASADRLPRSAQLTAALLRRAVSSGWDVVSADMGVDTTTPQGSAMAKALTAFADAENRHRAQRDV